MRSLRSSRSNKLFKIQTERLPWTLLLVSMIVGNFVICVDGQVTRRLSDNACEVTQTDGSIKYYACLAAPVRMTKGTASDFFNLTISPLDSTCGLKGNETVCVLVGSDVT